MEFENLSKYVHGLNKPAFELISDAAASFGYTPSCIRNVLNRDSMQGSTDHQGTLCQNQAVLVCGTLIQCVDLIYQNEKK